jgi:hypothetical protein
MAVIGAVITEFRANAAQFLQETGKVTGSLDKVGKSAGTSQRQMADFATKGLGTVIPGAEGAEHAIAKVIEKMISLGGALALIGKGGILAGGFLTGMVIGERLKDEIKNWWALGETVSKTTERLKTEAEEQTKFADQRARGVRLLLNLEKERKELEGAAKTEEVKRTAPIEAAGREFEAAVAVIEAQRALRERDIIETIKQESRRRQALVESAGITAAARLKAEREFHNNVAKLNQDAADLAKKTYIDQTTALIEQLQKRIDLGKAIQIESSAAAQRQLGADVFAPFREAEETKRDMASIAEGFALLLADGKRWADVAPEIFRVNADLEARGFVGLLTAIDQARVRFEGLRLGQKDLATDTDNLRVAINNLPAAMQASDPAVVAFTQKLALMEQQSLRTSLAIQQLANIIATTTAPPVTAAEQFQGNAGQGPFGE